ncbi:insulinase family protein [bacterium]|nr:insulinase family protein [bacterium]
MSAVQRVTLSSGLRVIHEFVPGSTSVAVSLTVVRGARHEPDPLAGITHFIEHMLFKGTRKRDLYEIAREINHQGGSMNAVTSHDYVRAYTRAINADLEAALELLDDMFWGSTFPPEEIERERGVVLEEIAESRDFPEDLCFENFQSKLWAPHSLGRPILGTEETVSTLRREDLLFYWENIRTPANSVLSIAGGVELEEALAAAERIFSHDSEATEANHHPPAGEPRSGRTVVRRRLEQVQFCFGVPAIPRKHPGRYVLAMLDSILGGGMGSRLFNEVRERRGLAYTIASSAQTMLTEGQLCIYGSSSPQKIGEVLAVCREQIADMCSNGPTQEELETARQQLERAILLALESNAFRSGRNAEREVYGEEHASEEVVLARLREVTTEQIREMAVELFVGVPMTISMVGPVPGRTTIETVRLPEGVLG